MVGGGEGRLGIKEVEAVGANGSFKKAGNEEKRKLYSSVNEKYLMCLMLQFQAGGYSNNSTFFCKTLSPYIFKNKRQKLISFFLKRISANYLTCQYGIK